LIQSSNEEDNLKSANYLMELQDLKGLEYYVEWMKKNMQLPKTIRQDKSPLLSLRVVEAVPYLIDLLKLTYHPDFQRTRFDHLEHHVLDALSAIALRSKENYANVRKAMENFIEAHTSKIENINFLNIFVEKLDQKYYLLKSENISINDAIEKLDIIVNDSM